MAVPGMTGGDQKPLLKYNAKSGKFHIDDKAYDKVTMVMDFDNAESGWVYFRTNAAPDFKLAPMANVVAGSPYPASPPDTDAQGKPLFKRCFRMMVKLSDKLADGKPAVREFASGSQATVKSVDQLHTAWLAGRQNGKLPIVTCSETQIVEGPHGPNYKPIFRIAGWIDRPADLKPDKVQTSAPQAAPPAHVVDPIGEPEVFDEDPEDASFT